MIKEAEKKKKEERKNALDNKLQSFMSMVSNLENTMKAFEREKQKATFRIKALQSENLTLRRKLDDKSNSKLLESAKDNLNGLIDGDEGLPSSLRTKLLEIKLLIEADQGNFQAETKVKQFQQARKTEERNRRMSVIMEAGPPNLQGFDNEDDGTQLPPPPPPPPMLGVPPPSLKIAKPSSSSPSKSPMPKPVGGGSGLGLLDSIRKGAVLKKIDMEQVKREKEENDTENIFKSLEDTMKMAMGIRRAVMDTQVCFFFSFLLYKNIKLIIFV